MSVLKTASTVLTYFNVLLAVDFLEVNFIILESAARRSG